MGLKKVGTLINANVQLLIAPFCDAITVHLYKACVSLKIGLDGNHQATMYVFTGRPYQRTLIQMSL